MTLSTENTGYLKWISEGEMYPSFIKGAIERLTDPDYPSYTLGNLRGSLESGIEKKISQYKRWIHEGDANKDLILGRLSEHNRILDELRSGQKTTIYCVDIPEGYSIPKITEMPVGSQMAHLEQSSE
ncbi:MAG: hypothetical protein ABIG84_01260 [archaeon]